MQLRNTGDTCIIDLCKITQQATAQVQEHNHKVSWADTRVITAVAGEILNDYLTCMMHWTKTDQRFDTRKYIDRLGHLLDNCPDSDWFIQWMEAEIENQLNRLIKLPTWRIIYVQIRGPMIKLELGEDFRIAEWMRDHGDEYRVTQSRHTRRPSGF